MHASAKWLSELKCIDSVNNATIELSNIITSKVLAWQQKITISEIFCMYKPGLQNQDNLCNHLSEERMEIGLFWNEIREH